MVALTAGPQISAVLGMVPQGTRQVPAPNLS